MVLGLWAPKISLLFDVDFTQFPVGAYTANLPANLSFARASTATVQTGASTIDLTPGTNIPRIGSLGLGWQGLVLEESRTNWSPNNAWSTGWNTNGSTLTSNYTTDPAGGTNSNRVQTPTAAGIGAYFGVSGWTSSEVFYSVWVRATTPPSDDVVSFDSGGTTQQPVSSMGGTWTRYTQLGTNTTAHYIVPANSGASGSVTSAARDIIGAFSQIETGPNGNTSGTSTLFATEYIDTSGGTSATRAGDQLTHTKPSAIIDNGRLSIELWIRPKGARGQYPAGCMLWYQDANNQSFLDSNGVLYVMVAGIEIKCGSLSWNAQEQLKIFVAAGNGITVAYYQDGSGTTYQIACPSTPLPPITPGTSIDLLQNGATHNFSAWVQRIAFWNSDSMPFEPNQLSGNVLWLRGDQGISYAMAPVTATGTTPPAVTLSGTPTLAQCNIEIDITTGGAVGTAAFEWKLNGTVQQTGVATAASVSLPGTGLTANFGTGTYATNNVYTSSVVVSQWNDLSGTGNNFSQSTSSKQPTYSTSGGPNSQPVLKFTASNSQNLTATTNMTETVATIFAVVVPRDVATSNQGILVASTFSIYSQVTSPEWGFFNGSSDNVVAVAAGTPYVLQQTIHSVSNIDAVTNGVLHNFTNGTSFPSRGGTALGCDPSGAYLTGDVAEILVYNRALSAGEIGQINSYLTQRYNIPLSSFTPNQLSGNVLWLRADQGITLNSTTVSQWNDLSGSNNNVSQATSGSQPTYNVNGGANNTPVIQFGGSQSLTSPSAVLGVSNWTAFLVGKVAGPDFSWGTAGNGWAFQTYAGSTRDIVAYGIADQNGSVASSNTEIWCAQNNGTTTTLLVNGIGDTLTPNTSVQTTVGSQTTVGGGNGTFSSGNVSEIIAYNRVLSASEIAQVHKYLSQRYNISISSFLPNQLSGNVLWLKADHGIRLNGTTVSQWNDLSGNNYNLSQATAADQPVYSGTGGANNQPYINWNGATGNSLALVNSSLAILQPFDVFVVARTTSQTTSNSGQYLLDAGVNQNVVWQKSGGGAPNIALYDGTSTCIVSPTLSTDFIIESFINGASSFQSLNNGALSTGNPNSGVGTGTTFTLGNYGAYTSTPVGWVGYIYEIIIFNRQLTDTERAQVLAYLSSNYNITV